MKTKLFQTGIIIFLLTLIAACGGMDEQKANFYEKGRVLFEEGEFGRATIEFKNAIQIDPKFAKAYYMLSKIALKEKNYRGAFSLMNKALELDPEDTDIQLASAEGMFMT